MLNASAVQAELFKNASDEAANKTATHIDAVGRDVIAVRKDVDKLKSVRADLESRMKMMEDAVTPLQERGDCVFGWASSRCGSSRPVDESEEYTFTASAAAATTAATKAQCCCQCPAPVRAAPSEEAEGPATFY
jgi:hypothetical protein